MSEKTDVLPDKLSDLIDLALADLEKVEQDDRYKVDMSVWHTDSRPCEVCLGGAVIAKTFKMPVGDLFNYYRVRLLDMKLIALDEVVSGNILSALDVFYGIGHEAVHKAVHAPCFYQIFPDGICNAFYERDAFYERSAPRFKQSLREIAEDLRTLGL